MIFKNVCNLEHPKLQACESLAFACLQSSLLGALKVWCQCRDICLCLLAFSLVQNQLDFASCQNLMDFTSISMQTYDIPFSTKFNVDVTSGTVQEVADSVACPDTSIQCLLDIAAALPIATSNLCRYINSDLG